MILRYAVAMPCYNNETSIDASVRDVLARTPFPVVIVDDGSDTPVSESLKSVEVLDGLASGRVSVLRHDKNLGKGAALQTAFKWALENNKTHVVSFDSDGQHLAREIAKLIETSRENPWSLIIGSRRFAENVPTASKIGRRYSNYWVNVETGHDAIDSQSGLRVYPMFHVQNLSFFTRKYDFEIEILIRLLWRGVEVKEVEIDVYYPPPHERVSHFDKWWDNVRIVSLNIFFVLLSLVREHTRSWRSSVSLGVGVLIGCTPLFGAHAIIAALVSFAFRLNFVFLFLGTQISIPPLAPFIAIASIAIGHYAMGQGPLLLEAPHSIAEAVHLGKVFFFEWFIGSLILGSLLGAAVGGLEYASKGLFSKPKTKKAAWTGKMRGSPVLIEIMKNIIRYMGLRVGYAFLHIIVPYFYLFAPRARKGLNEYWKVQNPSLSWWSRQKEVYKHLFTFARILVDRGYQSYSDKLEFQVDVEGNTDLYDVTGAKEGLIFVGAHIGGWDISAQFLKKNPESPRIAMVHFLAEGVNFDKIIDRRADATSKVDSIQTQIAGSLLNVKAHLEANKHVGFLADRAIGNQVELIPFFGKLAPFETRPYRIAVACRAPILFKYNFKTGPRRYTFVTTNYGKLEYAPNKDRKQQVYEWTETYAKTLETQMKRFPHQWFNFYPFWSSLPVEWSSDIGTRMDNVLLEELQSPTAPAPSRTPSPKGTEYLSATT